MIIYFSGTGNSRAVAVLLGERLGEKVVELTSQSPLSIRHEGESTVWVCPVYSWGIPPIVLNYIGSLSEDFCLKASARKNWVVLTCGDDTGLAPEMIGKYMKIRGIPPSGIWSVRMPNNYVLLPGFNVDSKKVEDYKLNMYSSRVKEIADKILQNGEYGIDCVKGSFPRFKTKVIYPLFMKYGMVPSKWRSTDACIGCRKCVQVCPVRNVGFDEKRRHPLWGEDCVSCLGCYHICPRHAVEYGDRTVKKGQYFFPAPLITHAEEVISKD